MVQPIQLPHDLELRLVRADDAAALADAYTRNRDYLAPWEPLRNDEFFTEAWHADAQSTPSVPGRATPKPGSPAHGTPKGWTFTWPKGDQ